MAAFDDAQENQRSSQGNVWAQRLTSILQSLKGIRLMDMRIPATAAITALLIVPIGWQLMNNSALTPPQIGDSISLPRVQLPATEMEEADDLMSDFYPSVVPQPEAVMEAPAVSVNSGAMSKVATRSLSAPAPMQDQAGYANSGDQFERFDDANVKLTSDAPVSTFSIDVDTASYAYVRRAIESGRLPQKDAVRSEELINYFDYDYPQPESADQPFAPQISIYGAVEC